MTVEYSTIHQHIYLTRSSGSRGALRSIVAWICLAACLPAREELLLSSLLLFLAGAGVCCAEAEVRQGGGIVLAFHARIPALCRTSIGADVGRTNARALGCPPFPCLSRYSRHPFADYYADLMGCMGLSEAGGCAPTPEVLRFSNRAVIINEKAGPPRSFFLNKILALAAGPSSLSGHG